MSNENDFVSGLLVESGNGLAGFASVDLLKSGPGMVADFEANTPGAWSTWFEHRVEELAAALSAGKPKLFEEQIRRAASHLLARSRSVEVVESAFRSLYGVLETELPADARPIAKRFLAEVSLDLSQVRPAEASEISPDTEEGRLVASYLVAILEGDRKRAFSVLDAAASKGWSTIDLYLQVLAPAQREIGQMWVNNEISIADEHFATTTTKIAISQLYASVEAEPANGKTVLASAVPGNRHDVGLQMITSVFELDGWRAICLGANLPTADLVRTVERFSTDLLLISAAVSNQLAAVADSIRAIRNHAPTSDVKILVGGSAFTGVADLALRYGADGYAANAKDALELSRRLLGLEAKRRG